MLKQEAKEKIKKLVERYKKLSEKEIKKDYGEERTKNVFIQPLFEALGWDFQDDVWPEKEAVQGRADYAFMLNGLTKFFVETKSLKTDLDLEIHAKQAIKYSWNKGVAWAVLTDFEGIKIFNAQTQSKLLIDKLVFEISYSEYIFDFDRLWLLSKESFGKNGLDQYAVKHGKKIKKLTVNEKLFSDLKEVRKELTNGFCEWNEKIDKEILEEGVQRIIERLMFIRVLEDKGLEDSVLIPVLREWGKNKNIQLFTRLITKFRELDDIYNSDLFDKHACEDWEEYSVKWDKIFSLLYGSQVHEYDFKEIPADILGGVYESYLGHIAQNPIKAGKAGKEKDKKEIKTKSRQKRKEQGIYYTPKFIVDYIVENTLGKKLKEVKSMRELKKIKVLDPACGSGSFLNKALQVINDKYKDFGNPGKQETKSEILMSNIYGVDLDPQAVELAKLNLLVSALDKKAKLPDLTGNVRVGNSLISGSEKELKKYFGKEWREKRPFNWEEEFRDVFAENKGLRHNLPNSALHSNNGLQNNILHSNKGLQPLVAMEDVCAYHITWVTHNSRISQRMIEYKIKKGPGIWLDEKEEIKITGFIRDIVKEDDLRVLAFNICGDHVHMLLVCAPDELANIVRKLKGKSAQKYKEYLKIGKEETFHLWAQKFSKTIIRPSREGSNLYRSNRSNKGLQPLVAENFHSHLHNAIRYIQKNRGKHNLQSNKGLSGGDDIRNIRNKEPQCNANLYSNKGLQPLVAVEAEDTALQTIIADMVCDIDSAFAPQYKGGFDVVIGNPPYISSRELNKQDKNYFENYFITAKDQYDIYILFIEKSLKLLKDKGFLSFIIPNKFLITRYGLSLRKYIFENSTLVNFKDYSKKQVFPDASVYPVVIVLKKEIKAKVRPNKNYDLLTGFGLEKRNPTLDKIDFVSSIVKFNAWRPLATSKNIREGEKIIISNREINRYTFDISKKGELSNVRDLDKVKNKIILKKLCYNVEASLDEIGYYPINTTYCLQPEEEDVNIKYILGILNSKLMTFYVRNKYSETALRGGFIELRVFQIKKLPILKGTKDDQKIIVKLVDKILKLNKQFQSIPENSDRWNLVKKEIEKVDGEINEMVFELYNLTKEEVGVINKKIES